MFLAPTKSNSRPRLQRRTFQPRLDELERRQLLAAVAGIHTDTSPGDTAPVAQVEDAPATPSVWRNEGNPFDVNGNDVMSSGDLLVLVNRLNTTGAQQLTTSSSGSGAEGLYLDVDGDNWLTAVDAAITMSALNDILPNTKADGPNVPGEGNLASDTESDLDVEELVSFDAIVSASLIGTVQGGVAARPARTHAGLSEMIVFGDSQSDVGNVNIASGGPGCVRN